MGYVLSGLGLLLAVVWMLQTTHNQQTQLRAAQAQGAQTSAILGRAEAAIVTLRNQDAALKITPAAPSLPQIVGSAGIVGSALAPPILDFSFDPATLRALARGAQLACADPTGSGRYTCTASTPPPK